MICCGFSSMILGNLVDLLPRILVSSLGVRRCVMLGDSLSGLMSMYENSTAICMNLIDEEINAFHSRYFLCINVILWLYGV